MSRGIAEVMTADDHANLPAVGLSPQVDRLTDQRFVQPVHDALTKNDAVNRLVAFAATHVHRRAEHHAVARGAGFLHSHNGCERAQLRPKRDLANGKAEAPQATHDAAS